ncbi:hypothetical protein GXP70_13115 [Paenibacillus lycopersici]|uniref:histidine kinase n=1 Tax=Paenibacillus lycopersici TaxID=2704462 RepID=A0A6C0G635_9BACL|nr:HAMP domain-containing sensor histidine kinase [Paenibacillus lycopersici]QHT60795.1 hypothetical protein GXP70_13115 [Paenibacillus lycopersici]
MEERNKPDPNKPPNDRPPENRPFGNMPLENEPFKNKAFKNRPVKNKPFKNRPLKNRPLQNKPFQRRSADDETLKAGRGRKRSKSPSKKPTPLMQTLKIIAGILMMNVLTYFCFSVAFTVIGVVNEKHGHAAVTEQLLRDGHSIAAAADGKTNAAGFVPMLVAFADSHNYTITYGKENSTSIFNASEADSSKQASQIKPEDWQRVMSGSEVKHVYRKYPFSQGTAVAGVPVTVGGERYGLFLEAKAPGLYQNFWHQVMIVFCGFLLMFILMLVIGRPWRERGGIYVYISAIRRMSKGDFTVMIDKAEQMPGHYGELATSINDMAAELSQLEQMRQAFISNVSHEIQSPLTSIRGFARALQQEGLDDQQRHHYAGIIEAESVRLSKLSDNLMKLTTLEADQQKLHPKPFRLDQQVRAMILACEPIWTEKNILMDVNLDERVLLNGDEELLSQVWMNLLTNSLKFTGEGGTVSVELKPAADGAVVCISDNGIGIAEEDLPHIFERFFKADKSRSRREKGSGSGLGLSIVKVIVDLHGGTVTASSKLGVGTTFTITLPNLPMKQEQ